MTTSHNTVRKAIRTRFAGYPSDAQEKLESYTELLRTFAKRMNLTAAKSAADYDAIVFADTQALLHCLSSAELLARPVLRCVDIGAGAGAPALPLAILAPNLTFSLVEPLRKRVSFLRTAVGSLGLADRVSVVEQKLDWDAPETPGAPFDLAISRATVAPELWLEGGRHLAPWVAVFHSSDEHSHPELRCAHETRYSVSEDRPRYVGLFERRD